MDKQDIAKKIKQLRNMTTDRGCTEAEATTAIKKLNELLKAYNMTITEVEMLQAEYTMLEIKHDKESPAHFLLKGISTYTDTRGWFREGLFGERIYVFVGTNEDVANARYLWELCNTAIKHEARKYEKENGRMDKEERNGFYFGICARLKERLEELKEENEDDYTKDQKQQYGLVIRAKQSAIKQIMDQEDISLTSKPDGRRYSADTREEGYARGDNVAIHKGVSNGNNSQTKLLGG